MSTDKPWGVHPFASYPAPGHATCVKCGRSRVDPVHVTSVVAGANLARVAGQRVVVELSTTALDRAHSLAVAIAQQAGGARDAVRRIEATVVRAAEHALEMERGRS